MKIEWFVQYYYSAEDVYKAKKMQWLVVIAEVILQAGYIYFTLFVYESFTIWGKVLWIGSSIYVFIALIWTFWGYEKSKISYRKSMMRCRKEVSEEFKNNWHEYKGSELTWKRDRWITIPQVGLMFIFMVMAILSIVRI